jgi:hypothetical protein
LHTPGGIGVHKIELSGHVWYAHKHVHACILTCKAKPISHHLHPTFKKLPQQASQSPPPFFNSPSSHVAHLCSPNPASTMKNVLATLPSVVLPTSTRGRPSHYGSHHPRPLLSALSAISLTLPTPLIAVPCGTSVSTATTTATPHILAPYPILAATNWTSAESHLLTPLTTPMVVVIGIVPLGIPPSATLLMLVTSLPFGMSPRPNSPPFNDTQGTPRMMGTTMRMSTTTSKLEAWKLHSRVGVML